MISDKNVEALRDSNYCVVALFASTYIPLPFYSLFEHVTSYRVWWLKARVPPSRRASIFNRIQILSEQAS